MGCVFLDLCFPSSFPNTRKYFPENFLKCNQTAWKHFPFLEISISRKYVFSRKRFTATKHSLSHFGRASSFTAEFWALCDGLNICLARNFLVEKVELDGKAVV